VYKRHALKSIQYKLISTEEGWKLAQALLNYEALQQNSMSPLALAEKARYFAKTVPSLIDFIKKSRIEYAHDQEFEADACAAIWLCGIGVKPKDGWQKYQDILGSVQQYSTEHPSSADRAANFMEVANSPRLECNK
jgi:hypothetical protein